MSDKAEIEALRKRVEELEAKAKPPEPPKPFVPAPYQRYDPTANFTMPPSALQAMLAAEPRGFMQGVLGDNRAPTAPATIPSSSQQPTSGHGSNVAGSGTGWAHQTPLGPPPGVAQADRIVDEFDRRDRLELIEQKAREQAALKAMKR